MNLAQPFREEVEKVGQAVSDTFDLICSKINALWNVQHTATGGHKDITATSLTVTAGTADEVAAGTATGNVNANGTGPHRFGGNVIAQYTANQQTEIGTLNSTGHGYNDSGGIEFRSSSGRRWSWVARSVAGVHQCNLTDISNALTADTIGIEVNGTTYYLAPGAGATGVLGSNSVPPRRWSAFVTAVDSNGPITSSSATGGIGYATGAGGTVAQGTSKATGVTLNAVTGQITMFNDALGAGAKVSFAVANTSIGTTDGAVVWVDSGGTANAYRAAVTAVGVSTFTITVENITGGGLSESPVIGFAVIKAVTS